jgi:hypothetical protein
LRKIIFDLSKVFKKESAVAICDLVGFSSNTGIKPRVKPSDSTAIGTRAPPRVE